MVDRRDHAARVDWWIDRSARAAAPERVLSVVEAKLQALWARVAPTLGEITLAAVLDRVLHNATEQFPLLHLVTTDTNVGVDLSAMTEVTTPLQAAEVLRAFRVVFIEFLTVVGNLTAELFSDELHEELASRDSSSPQPNRAGEPTIEREAQEPRRRTPKDHIQ
jgi:hypothetical protein